MSSPRPNKISQTQINRVRQQLEAQRKILQRVLRGHEIDNVADVTQALYAALHAPSPKRRYVKVTKEG